MYCQDISSTLTTTNGKLQAARILLTGNMLGCSCFFIQCEHAEGTYDVAARVSGHEYLSTAGKHVSWTRRPLSSQHCSQLLPFLALTSTCSVAQTCVPWLSTCSSSWSSLFANCGPATRSTCYCCLLGPQCAWTCRSLAKLHCLPCTR